jgi:hypothetical protein
MSSSCGRPTRSSEQCCAHISRKSACHAVPESLTQPDASFDLVVFHTTLCPLIRRVSKMLGASGFHVVSLRSHGYTQTTEPTYMLTLIDRGADILVGSGSLTREAADALRTEARRRAQAGEFFGHISFVSVIARKPNHMNAA